MNERGTRLWNKATQCWEHREKASSTHSVGFRTATTKKERKENEQESNRIVVVVAFILGCSIYFFSTLRFSSSRRVFFFWFGFFEHFFRRFFLTTRLFLNITLAQFIHLALFVLLFFFLHKALHSYVLSYDHCLCEFISFRPILIYSVTAWCTLAAIQFISIPAFLFQFIPSTFFSLQHTSNNPFTPLWRANECCGVDARHYPFSTGKVLVGKKGWYFLWFFPPFRKP